MRCQNASSMIDGSGGQTRERREMKTDDELQVDVEEELFTETRVDDEEIAASARDGVLTLRGTVGSLGAKLAAGRAARRVSDVRDVRNELEVRLLTEHRRD